MMATNLMFDRPGRPLTLLLAFVCVAMFTLPQLFKKAGYDTAVIGKWHLGLGKKGTPVNWNGEVKPGPLEVGFDYSFLLPSTNDRVPCVYLENYKVVNLNPADPLFLTRKKPEGFSGTVYPDGKKDREAMTYYQSSGGHNNSVINGIGRIGYMWGGKDALWNDETMADEFVKQAKKYITSKKDKPFFLYFSSQDIHVPRAPHPRFKGKSKLTYRGDAMVQLDWTTGEILKMLEENGLCENTIVIFSSDNGPVYDDGYKDGTEVRKSTQPNDRGHFAAGPYRGGKYQIYEGGTRVPFIIRWPGKIKPGKSSALVNQIDFIASFATLLNIKLSKDEARDSRNILDALLGKDSNGLPYTVEEARGGLALRKGPWKFIAGKSSGGKKKGKKPKKQNPSTNGQLYNLEKDAGEKTDVIDQHPEIASEMHEILQKIRDDDRTRKTQSRNKDE